jgi:hypothetical protein
MTKDDETVSLKAKAMFRHRVSRRTSTPQKDRRIINGQPARWSQMVAAQTSKMRVQTLESTVNAM